MTMSVMIAIMGLGVIIGYCIVMTLWVFCPRVLIRIADIFGVQIEEKEISPLFEDEVEEKQIEVKELKK